AVWRIFKYRITSQLPSVTCLLIHLPGEQTILRGGNNNLSTLQCYFLHLPNIEFDALTYCKYYELYTFTYAKDLVNQQSLPPNNYLEKEQEGCQRQGMVAQSVWQIHHELLSADYINKKGDIQQGENEALMWIA
ncbi:7158_t:CDS:2, partial [Cetraspora pellucida]